MNKTLEAAIYEAAFFNDPRDFEQAAYDIAADFYIDPTDVLERIEAARQRVTHH